MYERKAVCQDCGNEFYYVTINKFVPCTVCKAKIKAIPLTEAELADLEPKDGEVDET